MSVTLRRLLAPLVVLAASLGGLAISRPAAAAVVTPFAALYDKALFGDFVIAGNTVTSCPTSVTWADPNCAVGRSSNSSTLGTTYINDAFYMEYTDVDSDATTYNSSTARITVPPGATVDYARLWWVGNTGEAVRTDGSAWFACNASRPNTASPNKATAPPGYANAPFNPSTTPVKMKIGAGAYQSLTPEAGHFSIATAPTNGGRHYAASTDIKALLAAQPAGVPLDITVGNIWTPKGNNCTGGFAVTYVFKYANPDATYAPQTRQVLVFDGFVAQGSTDAPTNTNLTGFTLAGGTRRLGVGVIEGDQGIGGDQLIANGVALADPRITPATTTNYMASTVDGQQNPSVANVYGLDAKTRDVPESVMPNGLTNIPIRFTTSGDQYFPFLFAFSAPVTTNFVSGTVWHDVDGDGVFQASELGIPGTTITVTGTDTFGNPVNRTTTTNAGGGYRFDGLLNGTYTVTETQPSAYANSPGTTSPQYVSNTRTPLTFSAAVPTGITSVNFAEIQSSIAGTVYHDQDASGAKNAAEPGIAGVTVYLTGTDVNGAPVGLTATTAADGSYKFSNLAPGTYVVTEAQPAGWGDGLETVGSSGGTSTTNDKIEGITLVAGSAATGYNFAEKKAGLSGTVYVDANNDGIKSGAAEIAIAGVTITVTGVTETGAPVNMTTTTAADGSYSFPTLLPGTYTVIETQPAAYGDGIDTIGTVNATPTGTASNDQFAKVILTGAGAGSGYNFGELPGSISGKVWYDKDADSVIDGTETSIAGVTITLTKPDGTTATTTTAADGTYSFTGLPAGNYTITETQPTGYGSSLNPTNVISGVAVAAGSSVVDKNFGETLGSISGRAYLDTINDNVYTAGEQGLSGVTITLTKPGGATLTTTTAADGTYTFSGLPAGTYGVSETQPSGLIDDADAAGSAGGTVGADQVTNIVLGAAVNTTGYNFGETGTIISGTVYVDVNNNGVQDSGEVGIPGTQINIEAGVCYDGFIFDTWAMPNAAGTCPSGFGWQSNALWTAPSAIPTTGDVATLSGLPRIDSVVTDANGNYSFIVPSNLAYRLTQVQPTAYSDGIAVAGTQGVVTQQTTNEIVTIGALTVGATNITTRLAAAGSPSNNFGELAGEISGYAYLDTNNDGLRAGDSAIANVLVTLTDGVTTWMTTTDAAGKYSFVGLPISAAGITYSIIETQPATYFDGKETSLGTINPAGTNDKITSVALTTAARIATENNFGERLGTISGKVWYDSNKNGVADAAEVTGIVTTITITNGNGVIVWTGPTAADGTYTSSSLPPGNYTVTETQPATYGSSTTNAMAVALTSVTSTGVNFGETLGSLAGAVFADSNKNGVRDPGEAAISNVTVTLTKPDATTITATTNASGDYLFVGLIAGNYTIVETQPSLYNDGAETVGTTGGTATAPDSFTVVSLAAGEDAVGYLFGELSPSVQGTVYYDANRDGLQNVGEPGIPGVVLTLVGPGGVNLTAGTDINGNYIFPSVPVGPGYTLTESQPAGYGSSEQPTNSITNLAVLLTGVTGQNFGDTLSSLAGTVYNDANNNGVQDASEVGIAGVSVTVSGTDSGGQAINISTTTDASGHYKVVGLLSGTYAIEEVQPANYDDGKDAAGTVAAGATGSQDQFSAPDRIAGIVLATADAGVNFNFGEIGTSVSGTVFRDAAKNGTFDPGIDTAIAAVTVKLYDATGTTVLATAVSAPDGSYTFPNLPIGTYVVKETQPAGYADTTGAAGPNNRTVTASVGGIGGVDFGETLGSITGTVWADLNKDGVRAGLGDPIAPASDAGIAGVTVKLYDAAGTTLLFTVTTNAMGEYIFDNLVAGTYTVKETQPARYGDGTDLVGTRGGTASSNDVISGIVLAAGDVATTYDFAEIGAKISGTVWNDRDSAGDIDASEVGRLAGVIVTLDDGNPATSDPTAVTNASGYYEFLGVPTGSYTVTETQPVDYASTTADTLLVTVVLDGAGVPVDVINQNFGETAGSVGNLVWNDRNGDGLQDANEPGIPGVTVTATAAAATTASGTAYTFTTTTDSAGAYNFPDLPLGTWTITVTPASLPAGMTAAADADGVATPHVSVVVIDSTHLSSLIQDFGYRGNGSIGNLVWNDRNGNGAQDASEPGIPGIAVTATITIAGSPVVYSTTTDASGAYSFPGLAFGTYIVAANPANLPAGMTQSFDADGVGSSNASTVTLDATTPADTAQDFGYRGAGSIGDFVWVDTNGNGVQDSGEPGIPGVPVTLTTVINTKTVTYTVLSDATGHFTVGGLPLGSYTVTMTPDPTLTPTFDADGTGATPNVSTVILTAGTPTSAAQDFGYQGGGSIGNLIWNDLNGDGAQNANEPGLPGVKVTIVAATTGGPVTFTAMTDANGAYLFSGLPYAVYTVTVDGTTLPAGVTQTGDPDATKDNTATVTLNAATPTSLVQDFGYKGVGKIGDTVFNDLDGNGTQDAGEPGVPGAKVTLVTTIAGSPVTYTATTDANGTYVLNGLPLGAFTVTVDPLTLPTGLTATFDADGIATLNTSAVTLTAGSPTATGQDFGYQGAGSIGDLVWLDVNGNGGRDVGEPGLAGVTVTASTVIAGTTVVYSAVTNASGAYTISGIPLGDFTVATVAASLPAGVTQTADADGVATPNTSAITLTAGTPTSTVQDFGYKGPGTVGNLIWNDLNGDGVQQGNEPGLPGVKVIVTATIGGAPVTLTTTTGPDGSYRFDGLPLGAWTITLDPLTLPAGVTNTGDPDGAMDSTAIVTLIASAPTSLTQDFGFKGAGSIGDLVWIDTNADGVKDATEAGVAGVGITITTTIGGSLVTYHATTAATGAYTLAGVPLGTFTVTVDASSIPAGVTQTFDSDGVGTPNASAVTLSAGAPASLTQDFGFKGPGKIGDIIFNDLNGNGSQDAGEPGIPGVKVTATATVGGSAFAVSAVTIADGTFTIAGLPLAAFVVTVDAASLPAGVVQTADPDATLDGTSTVTLTAADPIDSLQDFGYKGPGAIGDRVWNDLNGDGIGDVGEPGLPGVKVIITTVIAGATVTYTTITSATGAYQLSGLPLATFTVAVDPTSLPAGVVNTFDADGGSNGSSVVTLTAALPTSDSQDFGYRGPGKIGDFVWNDLNANGVQEVGESGIPGVTLTIVTTIAGSPVTYQAETAADGSYTLAGLPLGAFTVTVSTATLPNAMVQTFDADGTGTGTGDTSAVTLTAIAPTSTLQDFGYVGNGVIGDLIWNDLNGDGSRDLGEPGIPGVKVTITTMIAGSPVTYTDITDASGAYLIGGLPLGSYTVTVDPLTVPAGVMQTGDPDATKDNTATVILTVAVPLSGGQDFGYQGPGSIGNSIWNDLNNDGIQQSNEPGLPGVKVTITTVIAGGAVTYTATTNASGIYIVAGLPLGSFTVTIDPTTLPAGVVPVSDPDGGNDDTATVVLTAAAPTSAVQDFGYQGPGVIGDLVWNDLNGNGTKDSGEPGLPGIALAITTVINGTTVTYPVTTDANGAYAVSGLPLGDFTVAVTADSLPAGVVTTADPVGALDGVATVTLTAAAPTSAVQDFGYQGPGVIGDLVWNDLNGDGIKDADEPGLPGVAVVITTVVNGTTVTYRAITDANGAYVVSGLPLGDFTVTVDATTLTGGLVNTGDASGAHDGVSMVTLTPMAPTAVAQDFGYQGPGVIGDLVWNDLNGDGIKDANEPGLPGVVMTVTTLIAGSTVTYTTMSDATGGYRIAGLPLGAFVVTVDTTYLPAGVMPSGDPDGGADHTAAITLTVAAPTSAVQNFGYQGPGVIGDLVWNDLNGDGIQSSNEPGLPGVTVTMTTTVNGQQVTFVTNTDSAGGYTLAGLPYGRYTVTVDPATLPAGVLALADSDGGMDNTATVALTVAAPASPVQDFAYQGPGVIGNTVWNDLNGDGIQSSNEPGLPGVKVTITTVINGTVVSSTTVTAADGSYGFSGLPLGTFTVAVDPATLPAGVLPSFDSDDPADGSIATPNTTQVILTLLTPTSAVQDFGYQGPGVIGNLVWNDMNGNGTPESGEPGFAMVDIMITTTIHGSVVTYRAVTDTNGIYQVQGLALGMYSVAVLPATLPPTVKPTFDADGVATLNVSSTTLTVAAATSAVQNFGNFIPSGIGNLVWNDLNANGLQDANEPGLEGVAVHLVGTDGLGNAVNLITATGTGASAGLYLFANLAPGTYTVTVTAPAGFLEAPMTIGVDRLVDSNGLLSSVTLLSGIAQLGADVGLFELSSISGLVYADSDANGTPGAGCPGTHRGLLSAAGACEAGIPGVTVTLTGTTGAGVAVSLTATTGADGVWTFPGLWPGTYGVTETQPAEWSDGIDSPPAGAVAVSNDVIGSINLSSGLPVKAALFGEQGWPVVGKVTVEGSNAPIADVIVTLTGTDILGQPVTMTLKTGADGSFTFANVPAGSYVLTETQPAGLKNGSTNPTNVITFVLGAGVTPSHDFTELASSISGTAFIDLNNNGVHDAGDLTNPGVTITVSGTDAGGNAISRSVVTGADGSWSITGLRSGDYQITETQPPAMVDGSATAGDAGGTVSGPNIMIITLQPGVTASGYSFGDVRRVLPTTGGSPMPLLEVASALLALGVALRFGRRKERQA